MIENIFLTIFSIFYRKDIHNYSKKINYVGFEPSPIEFHCLQDNVNPSKVYNKGLWNKEGELEFYISSQGADSSLIEPKKFDEKSFIDFKGDICIVPPNSFALARSIEYFKIPRNVLTICLGKSTYARCGIIVNVTPLEPGWEGHVTLEFSNTTPLPAKIYANEGAAQFIFLKGSEEPETTYAQRNGKYMKQTGVTLPKV